MTTWPMECVATYHNTYQHQLTQLEGHGDSTINKAAVYNTSATTCDRRTNPTRTATTPHTGSSSRRRSATYDNWNDGDSTDGRPGRRKRKFLAGQLWAKAAAINGRRQMDYTARSPNWDQHNQRPRYDNYGRRSKVELRTSSEHQGSVA